MKFGHQWKTRKQNLPPDLATACIDYKQYKKITTNSNQLLQSIIADANKCHKIFGQYSQSHSNPVSKALTCFQHLSVLPTYTKLPLKEQDLLEFAHLNALCLRKLCKRLDKRFNTHEFTNWLNTSSYAFINGSRIKQLELKLNHLTHIECPICLEENIPDLIILNCGHILCKSCTINMLTSLPSTKGTLKNIIAYAKVYHPHTTLCPLCRNPKAFNDYIHINKNYH